MSLQEVVFTGRAVVDGVLIRRERLEAAAKNAGLIVCDHVSMFTSYLVCDDPPKGGTGKKFKAAKKYGTKIITSKHFLSKYEVVVTLDAKDMFS